MVAHSHFTYNCPNSIIKTPKKIWNMPKVNNNDTRMKSKKSLSCFNYQLWTQFTLFSIKSVAEFGQVNVCWYAIFKTNSDCVSKNGRI